LEVKLLITGRQASSIDIWMEEVDVSVNKKKSNIVAKASRVEGWVLQDSGDSIFFMNLRLWSFETTCIIFSYSDL